MKELELKRLEANAPARANVADVIAQDVIDKGRESMANLAQEDSVLGRDTLLVTRKEYEFMKKVEEENNAASNDQPSTV